MLNTKKQLNSAKHTTYFLMMIVCVLVITVITASIYKFILEPGKIINKTQNNLDKLIISLDKSIASLNRRPPLPLTKKPG